MDTMTSVLVLLAAVLVLWLAWVYFSPQVQRPDVRFFDQKQDARTIAVEDSSYQQRTNHMPRPPIIAVPPAGIETPFQVNAYKAHLS